MEKPQTYFLSYKRWRDHSAVARKLYLLFYAILTVMDFLNRSPRQICLGCWKGGVHIEPGQHRLMPCSHYMTLKVLEWSCCSHYMTLCHLVGSLVVCSKVFHPYTSLRDQVWLQAEVFDHKHGPRAERSHLAHLCTTTLLKEKKPIQNKKKTVWREWVPGDAALENKTQSQQSDWANIVYCEQSNGDCSESPLVAQSSERSAEPYQTPLERPKKIPTELYVICILLKGGNINPM